MKGDAQFVRNGRLLIESHNGRIRGEPRFGEFHQHPGHGRRQQHLLTGLVGRQPPRNLSNLQAEAHFQQAIRFVENAHLTVVQFKVGDFGQVVREASRSGDNHVGTLAEQVKLLLHAFGAVNAHGADHPAVTTTRSSSRHIGRQFVQHAQRLLREFARGGENNGPHAATVRAALAFRREQQFEQR